jgi:hypothetical protein
MNRQLILALAVFVASFILWLLPVRVQVKWLPSEAEGRGGVQSSPLPSTVQVQEGTKPASVAVPEEPAEPAAAVSPPENAEPTEAVPVVAGGNEPAVALRAEEPSTPPAAPPSFVPAAPAAPETAPPVAPVAPAPWDAPPPTRYDGGFLLAPYYVYTVPAFAVYLWDDAWAHWGWAAHRYRHHAAHYGSASVTAGETAVATATDTTAVPETTATVQPSEQEETVNAPPVVVPVVVRPRFLPPVVNLPPGGDIPAPSADFTTTATFTLPDGHALDRTAVWGAQPGRIVRETTWSGPAGNEIVKRDAWTKVGPVVVHRASLVSPSLPAPAPDRPAILRSVPVLPANRPALPPPLLPRPGSPGPLPNPRTLAPKEEIWIGFGIQEGRNCG